MAGHMEIINLHSCLLKMPALRKINWQCSERTSGKMTAKFACVYHYCSYSRLPLPPEPNLDTLEGFFSNFFFPLNNQWKSVLLPVLSCFIACLFPYAHFFVAPRGAFLENFP